MKIKLLIALFALCCITASVSAQDAGAPDSVIVTFTQLPNVAAGDSSVVFEVYFATDQTITNASYGMSWDFDGFEMDGVVFTADFMTAFNLAQLAWANGSIDSTNSKRLFQTTGLTLNANFWLTPGLAATFTGHVTRWTDGDVITITPNNFAPPGFVPDGGSEFLPVWGGDAVLADVEILDLGNLPTKFDLGQNYPNPFNPETIIEFDLPQRAEVKLTIFNVLGQQVVSLINKDMQPGYYRETWDGTADSGNKVASGIYFYRLTAGEVVKTKKMMLLK